MRHLPLLLVVVLACAATLLLTTAAAAQSDPAFDVASVKPSPTGVNAPVGASFTHEPGGHLVANGATLRDLVARAYGLQDFQLVSSQPWMSSARFDIRARAPESGAVDGTRGDLMLRALLEQRFGLKVHRETREAPVYVITVASPGQLGPLLRVSPLDCADLVEHRDAFDGSPVAADRSQCQPRTLFIAGVNGPGAEDSSVHPALQQDGETGPLELSQSGASH